MGGCGTPDRGGGPVGLLICGLIASDEEHLNRAKARVAETWGSIARESPIIPFNFTRYYEKEMGEGLLRQFLAFDRVIRQEDLPSFKHQAIALERAGSDILSGRRCRRANIDPGYVALERLVLATTKNYSHRVWLGNGIFAELTLVFRSGTFRPLEWTYPDYRTPLAIAFFNEVRADLKWRLRGGGGTPTRA